MPKKHHRHYLRAKQAKSILEKASATLKADFNRIFKEKTSMELVETDFAEIFLIDGKPLFFKFDGKILPTLVFSQLLASAPRVIVDMGALPHVCNGANVMAPGIVEIHGDFEKGDLVVVADEKHDKAVAIGEAFCDAENAKNAVQGPVARNLHFVGDKIWNFITSIEHREK